MTQKKKCLSCLRNAGSSGLTVEQLSQCIVTNYSPRRVSELIDDGYDIVKKKEGNTVRYTLHEVPKPKLYFDKIRQVFVKEPVQQGAFL